jgi:hypothetical protein
VMQVLVTNAALLTQLDNVDVNTYSQAHL